MTNKFEAPLTIDKRGNLSRPNFHDARVVGIFTGTDREVLIIVKEAEHNGLICVKLSKIKHFQADNFRDGNIILDFSSMSGPEIDREEIVKIIFADNKFALNSKNENYITGIMEKFCNNELFLVQLSPSYGCEFNCICGSVEFVNSAKEAIESVLS